MSGEAGGCRTLQFDQGPVEKIQLQPDPAVPGLRFAVQVRHSDGGFSIREDIVDGWLTWEGVAQLLAALAAEMSAHLGEQDRRLSEMMDQVRSWIGAG